MIIGTAVKITATLDATPSTIKADTYDQLGALKNSGNMVLNTGYTYDYVMQSDANWKPGKYKTIITAILGSYTSKEQITYTLD